MPDSAQSIRAVSSLWFTVVCILAVACAFLAYPVAAAGPDEPVAAEDSEATAAAEEALDAAEGEALAELTDPAIPLADLERKLVPLPEPELAELAATWQSLAREGAEAVLVAESAVGETEGSVEDAARSELTQAQEEQGARFEKFSAVVNAWEIKGGDADQIKKYRAYRDVVFLGSLQGSDAESLVDQALGWLTDDDGGRALLIGLASVVVALLVLWIIAGFIRRQIVKWLDKITKLSGLLVSFIGTMAFWVIMIVGLAATLSMLGVDVTPILALIGGASFILAFAFQDTLGNFASGLMIMINEPFDEGDVVELNGVVGTVNSLSIVATTLKTPDNKVIVLPNSSVWGNVIQNMTAEDTRRVDLVFGIAYEDSMDDAIEIMTKVVKAHPDVLDNPAPVIRVHELADSSVNFVCRPWTKTGDYWGVYWDLTQQVKAAFDEAGISIPYPQSDVHMYPLPETPPANAA